jgi:hypothetical protein
MGPMRVFVKVSKESPYFDFAWTRHNDLILAVVKVLEEKDIICKDTRNDSSSFLAVAVDRYNTRVFFVFDINNLEYNFDEAHLEGKNDLPVVIVSLSQKGNHAYPAAAPLMDQVNREIRRLYNLNGIYGKLPFYEDHANGGQPSYPQPRSCKAV